MKLRQVCEKDLEKILIWRNSPAIRKNMYTNHVISWQEHSYWYKHSSNDKTKQVFILSDNERDFGVVNFSEIDLISKSAFWGFYAAPDGPAGTGLVMEYYALEYAFAELKLHKLNCEVIEFNKAVINMHKKYGFQEEGVFRDYYFDGVQFHNVVRLGMMQSEWELGRARLEKRINGISL